MLHIYIYIYILQFRVLSYCFSSKTGIGAGLESMSISSIGWEGQVNPRVRARVHTVCCCLFFLGLCFTHSLLQISAFQKAQDCLLPMGITSENVAHRYGVTRQEQDQAAVSSLPMVPSNFLLPFLRWQLKLDDILAG
jgi:hypothetical protein